MLRRRQGSVISVFGGHKRLAVDAYLHGHFPSGAEHFQIEVAYRRPSLAADAWRARPAEARGCTSFLLKVSSRPAGQELIPPACYQKHNPRNERHAAGDGR